MKNKEKTNPNKEFLKMREACDIIGRSTGYIRKHYKAVKFGGSLRYRRSHLLQSSIDKTEIAANLK